MTTVLSVAHVLVFVQKGPWHFDLFNILLLLIAIDVSADVALHNIVLKNIICITFSQLSVTCQLPTDIQ